MKSVIALTWIAILMCSSGEDGFLRDSVNDNRLEDLLHEILRSTNTRDVFILIQNHRNDHIAAQIISTVFETVSKLLPTISIDVMQKSKSPDDLATSDTLLIYLYASRVNLESEFWEQIVSNLLDVSLGSHTPKILFLLVEDESDTYIEDFYKYLWTQKMIRVEILEILSSMNLMIAHRYNPFSNSYTKEYDSLDTLEWYSDKVKNMHKQPMCCQTEEELNTKSSHSPSESFFRVMILSVLSIKMNFNFSKCNDVSEADVYPPRYNYLQKLDDTVDYINVFSNTDVCLITPILPAKTVILWNFFSTICLGAAIVIVFLVASKLLQINERLQRVMYLINVLLGFSITLLPTTSSEKVLFLSVVTASSMYTTMFYTEIFELAFVNRVYEIDDFEDLARSGLTVMIDEVMYPEFMNSSQIPWSVKRKMLPWKVTYDENILGLEPRANTSYFFKYQIAEMFAKWRRDAYGQHLFKLNNLCVEIRSVLLTLKKRSPYKERVEDIAMRMADLSCKNTEQTVGVIYTRTNFVTLQYVTDSWGTKGNGFRLVITAVKDPKHTCKDFRCTEKEFCIEQDLLCDGVNHCGDGSDESIAKLCANSEASTILGMQPIWFAVALVLLILSVAGMVTATVLCFWRQRVVTPRHPHNAHNAQNHPPVSFPLQQMYESNGASAGLPVGMTTLKGSTGTLGILGSYGSGYRPGITEATTLPRPGNWLRPAGLRLGHSAARVRLYCQAK